MTLGILLLKKKSAFGADNVTTNYITVLLTSNKMFLFYLDCSNWEQKRSSQDMEQMNCYVNMMECAEQSKMNYMQ